MRVELRILTGRHAGARVMLDSLQHLLGPGAEADLQITDWSSEPTVIEVTDNEVVYYPSEQPERRQTMTLLQAKRFGTVVVCVGPSEAQWPDDFTLLQSLLAPTQSTTTLPTPAPHSPHFASSKRVFHVAGWAAVLMVMVGAAVAFHGWPTETQAATAADPQVQIQSLQAALKNTQLPDLKVHADGTMVQIQGLVPDRNGLVWLQHWVKSHPGHWRLRVSRADTIAQAIREALGQDSLAVRYQGNGVFLVDGQTLRGSEVHRRIGQLQNDYVDQEIRINEAITELDPRRKPPDHYDAALADHSLYYIETPDGTKHFNLQPTMQ